MAESDQPVPQAATGTMDKIKAAVPSIPALAMSAGAGAAGGGLLDQDLSDVISDVAGAAGAAWVQHPGSWAGVIIVLAGLAFHLKGKGN